MAAKSGLVPCKNNGKKTRCYKIAKKDVAEYLYRRESDPMHYTPPSGWYYNYPKHRKPAASLERKLNYKGEERLLVKEWYEQQLANYPDVLTVAQVCEVTGQPKSITGKLANAFGKNCKSRYLKTVMRFDTMTNSPPSRTHYAVSGCLAAKRSQNSILLFPIKPAQNSALSNA